ncbi:MAG: peptide chain release factor 1 [Chloroflexi bacterium]|nr:peptide chain release factor 1 [Chloroflexota bacterium]
MQQTTLDKLKAIAERQAELEELMARPGAASDSNTLRRLGREYNDLRAVADLWREYERAERDLNGARSILEDDADRDVKALAREEIASLDERLAGLGRDIERALLPKDVTEHADAVVEIRAGAGGDEAGLFAAELFRMYQRYAETRGWKLELVNVNETGMGGIKEVTFEVAGDQAYTRLKHESGVHRVQRVPETESQGRIHTSTATVAVLPKAEEIDIEIGPEDLRIDIFHAGGHGGQNVNKVATAVRLTHVPTGTVVTCQKERSQLQNRMLAMDVLRARLWDAELRKQREATSADRRAQVGTGDRSEKIRTYNYPQTRVTDHRIGLTSHNLPRVLDGDLSEFIDALLREEQARKLAAASRPE